MLSKIFVPIVRLLHRGYKRTLSPWIGQECRFYPTCSDYALEAIERRGIVRGVWLAFYRILRCNPWGGSGFDPVPTQSVLTQSSLKIKDEVLDGR